jgi:hypothetical protein
VVVSGRITDAFTGLLVEGAAITLTQGVDASRQIRFADAGGNYSFDEAMAGEGSVEIEASGFLAFGRANPEDAAIKIATDHAQHNFKLTPAATISGRITLEQEDGKQVVSASLLHEDFTDGIRRFIGIANVEGVTFTTTSPVELNGTFQFTGLPPGRYIIGVGPRIGGMSFVGGKRYHPEYGVTYYPGTTEFADALPVTLAAGQTQVADFKLVKRPLFRASGEISIAAAESTPATL